MKNRGFQTRYGVNVNVSLSVFLSLSEVAVLAHGCVDTFVSGNVMCVLYAFDTHRRKLNSE